MRLAFRLCYFHRFVSSRFTFPFAIILAGIILSGYAVNKSFAAPKRSGSQEPRLLSVAPLAVQKGQVVQLAVRGRGLKEATAAWFEQKGLRAELLDVQPSAAEVDLKSKSDMKEGAPAPVFVAHLRLTVDAGVPPGAYALRLVTPRGLSKPMTVWVAEGRTVAESAGPHETLNHAQSIAVPTVLSGEIGDHGQLDYYSFQGKRGDKVSIEVVHSDNFDAKLALYEPGGSWFDPDRATRLLSIEEHRTDLIPTQAEGTYILPHDGKYFLQVSGIYGEGCTGCNYLVRVAPGQSKVADLEFESHGDWAERSFSRPLDPSWVATLSARSVPTAASPSSATTVVAAGAGAGDAAVGTAHEVNFTPDASSRTVAEYSYTPPKGSAQPQMMQVPGLAEGVLDQPGEIQSYRFTVSPGQKLAFELETPDKKPPQFNPRIGITDAQDKELFSNVHRAVSLFNNNGEKHPYLKRVEPKVVYTFEHGGVYVLQVRDITSHYGGPGYRYRVLIRPQDPHVGEVEVAAGPPALEPQGKVDIVNVDHVNLVQGKTQKLDLLTSYEEGFTGDVYFSLKGLPPGVEFMPGTDYRDDKAPTDIDEDPQLVAPKIEPSTIVLLADPGAPLTHLPVLARLTCRPVVNGMPGKEITIKEIPIMVVAPPPPAKAKAAAKISGK